MTELRIVNDPTLSIARGLFAGLHGVNKFGRATECDNGVATDIWDRANPADAQPIWLAPTKARIHAIVSSSTSDDGSPVGVGARTIRLWGLQTWSSVESFEDITLDGTTAVNTTNSYVIVHRMRVLTSGASGPNVGTITATAATDATVTAQIQPGKGQTLMAIYGVPSAQVAYMTGFYVSINRSSPTGVNVQLELLWCFDVANQPTVFQIKDAIGTLRAAPPFLHPYNPYKGFIGPGIIKLRGTTDANDAMVDGGFDVILVDN